MIVIEHDRHRVMIVIRASGTRETDDCGHAVPEIEHAMEQSQGPLRVKPRLEDFRGCESGSLWQEVQFDPEHGYDFGRMAAVCEAALEDWGTTLSAPFAWAEMRFFPAERENEPDIRLSGTGEARGGAA